MQGKLSSRLLECLRAADPTEPLEVVVELHPANLPTAGSRQERIDVAKQGFEHDLAQVEAVLAAAGGRVLEGAWLNRTVRALVPPDGLDRVASSALVQAIDLPRPLEQEVQEASTSPAP